MKATKTKSGITLKISREEIEQLMINSGILLDEYDKVVDVIIDQFVGLESNKDDSLLNLLAKTQNHEGI